MNQGFPLEMGMGVPGVFAEPRMALRSWEHRVYLNQCAAGAGAGVGSGMA